jgi:RHS repeat-associated protein
MARAPVPPPLQIARAASGGVVISPQFPSAADRHLTVVPTDQSRRGVDTLPRLDPAGPGEDLQAFLATLTRDPGRSGQFTDVYDDPSGNAHVVVYSPVPINFLNGQGRWSRIDSSLVADTGGGWRNAANSFTVHFPARASSSAGVEVDLAGGVTLTMALTGAVPTDGATVGSDSVRYGGLARGVDAEYQMQPDKVKETLTVADAAAAGALSFDLHVSPSGRLRLEPTGDLTVLSASGVVVAVLPAPTVFDSNIEPVTGLGTPGSAAYQLQDLGGGDFHVAVAIDPAFLASAVYPLLVDPTAHVVPDINPSRDVAVDSAFPTSSYETLDYLNVGNPYSGSEWYSFVNFPVGSQVQAHRVVLTADAYFANVVANSSTENSDVKRVTEAWPASGSLTYNTRPSVSSTVWGADDGAQGSTYHFDLRDMYQTIIDNGQAANNVNYGIRLEAHSTNVSTNYKKFASSDYSAAAAVLAMQINDLPDAPTLAAPDIGATVATATPTLRVGTPVTDPNGDDVYVRYQICHVTTSNDCLGDNFTASTYTSGWVPDNDSAVTVPQGELQDGESYRWRAQLDDGYALNGYTFSSNSSYSASGNRLLHVAVNDFGSDTRYPMWHDDSLGNNVDLQVNESNGDLVLDQSLTSLSTQAGPLDISLGYNSQDNTNDGLGAGWVLTAGPSSDPRELPANATEIDSGESLQVRLRDGTKLVFPRQNTSGNTTYYASVGTTGSVIKNPNDTLIYTTTTGSRYVFGAKPLDSKGDPATQVHSLTSASPSTTNNGTPGFIYTFDTTVTPARLTKVTDPWGRAVNVTWTVNGDTNVHPTKIALVNGAGTSTFGGMTQAWNLTYDSTGRLFTVTGPETQWGTEKITYAYDAQSGDVSSITDGSGHQWSIGYVDPGLGLSQQVRTVTDPVKAPLSAYPTTFEYHGPYWYTTAQYTIVSDPRNNTSNSSEPNYARGVGDVPGAYETRVDFNDAGLPITVTEGRRTVNGVTFNPQTTMRWASTGNLICKRDPEANAIQVATLPNPPTTPLGCTEANPAPDDLQTDYTYQGHAPYKLTKQEDPLASASTPTTTRPTSTYAYDENLTGLIHYNWANDQMTGIPDLTADGVSDTTPVQADYGTGSPTGITPTDHWSIRMTGVLHTDTLRKYHFRYNHDDGGRLLIGSHMVDNCWNRLSTTYDYNCGSGTDDVVELWPGDHTFVLEYHEQTGNAHFNLAWDMGTGNSFVTIPGASFGPSLNLLTTKVDPRGITTTYTYASRVRGLVASTIQTPSVGTARETDNAYDSFGRVLTTTIGAGTSLAATETRTYGDAGAQPCATHIVGFTGEVTDNTCNPAGWTLTSKLTVPAKDSQPSQSRTTTTAYDLAGRVTKVTSPTPTADANGIAGPLVTDTAYYPDGRVKSLTKSDPDGTGTLSALVDSYTYMPDGSVDTETLPDPDGSGAATRPTISHTYDEAGNELTTVDQRGLTTRTTYDPGLGKASVLAPGTTAPSTTVSDPTGLAGTPGIPTTDVTRPNTVGASNQPVTTHTEFDQHGNATLTRSIASDLSQLAPAVTTYDPTTDDVLKITDPDGAWTQTTYNGFGQVLTRQNPSVANPAVPVTVETDSYDALGHLDTVKDAANAITDYTYDAEGRVTAVQQPGVTGASTIDYDAAGERVRVLSPGGSGTVKREWTYDEMGRLKTSLEYPTSTAVTTTYSYFLDGSVKQVADPRPVTEKFTYDGYGRLTKRLAGTSTDQETRSYDAAGNPLTVTTVNTPVTDDVVYTQDTGAERVKTVTENSSTTTYTYDPASGAVTSVADKAGTTSFGYDKFGRVATVTAPFGGPFTYTYFDSGKVKTRTDGGGVVATRGYDATGRSNSLSVTKGATTLASFGYGYNDLGQVSSSTQQITGSSDPVTSWSYLYDPAGRLQTATPSSGSQITYGYDGAGNRTTVKLGTATPVTTTYDGAGRPIKSDNGTPTVTTDDIAYTHDKVGNLLTAGNATYTYDTWNRTTKAVVGSNTVLYTYDGLDRAVTRKLNSSAATTNYYRGDTEQVVSTAGTLVAYGGSDTPLAQSASGTVSDYEQNLHGDMSLTVTTAGTASGTHTYDPYGKTVTATGTGATAGFGYQSDPTDPTTSLVDMGTRLYDPSQGRFTSQDSEFGGWDDPNTINQYTYAADSPLQYTDPTGMRICLDDACHYGVDPAHMTKAQQRTIWTQYNNSPSQKPSPPPTIIIQIYRHGPITPGRPVRGATAPQCAARVYAANCTGGGGPDFGLIGGALSGGLDIVDAFGAGVQSRASWLSGELRAHSSFAGRELPSAGRLAQAVGPAARLAGKLGGPVCFGVNFVDYYHGYSPSALLSATVKAGVKTYVATTVVGASTLLCPIELSTVVAAAACGASVVGGVYVGNRLGDRAAGLVP